MSRKARLLPPFATVVLASVFCIVVSAAAARPVAPQRTSAVTLFSDSFETPGNWAVSNEVNTQGGPGTDCDPNPEWVRVMGDALNPTHSGSFHYTNNPYNPAGIDGGICLNYLTLVAGTAIQTTAVMTSLKLSVWEHHHTEGPDPRYPDPCNPPTNAPDCDFGLVEVSKDFGATWTAVSPQIEGGLPNDPYAEQVFNITSPTHYTPGDKLLIRFTFSSDALVAGPTPPPPPPPPGPFEGWYIDDVSVVYEGPTAVDVASFVGRASKKGVTLTWKTMSESEIAGYNVWRFHGAKGVKVNQALVPAKGVSGGSTYRVLDRTARAGVAYRYSLQIVRKDGKRTWRANAFVRAAR
jgi:hypothetical protein